jgi:hypothetical protein
VLVEFCCASPGLVVAVTLLNDGGAKDVPAIVCVVKACWVMVGGKDEAVSMEIDTMLVVATD